MKDLNEKQKEFLNKFSWGAFGLHWVWAIASRLSAGRVFLTIFFLLIPGVNILYVLTHLGPQGRKIAWEGGVKESYNNEGELKKTSKWKDFAEFANRQRLLDKWGQAVVIVSVTLVLLGFIFGGDGIMPIYESFVSSPQEVSTTVTTSPSREERMYSRYVNARHENPNSAIWVPEDIYWSDVFAGARASDSNLLPEIETPESAQ